MAKRQKLPPVERLLNRYSLARVGSSAAVIDTETARDGLPFLTVAAFNQLYRHWPKIRDIPVTTLWATDPRRQVFEKGVTFDPGGREKKGTYNLWKGFSILPIEGDCSVFIDFLWRDICGEDDENFQYLVSYFAHLVQFPGDKPGVALVLKGFKGVGKDTAILLVRALVGTHFAYGTCTEDILGKFNTLLAQALLVHLEEATWGGDTRAAKKFQGLITSETIRVEPKGIDAYTTPNFARFLLSTNDEWAVPAGGDDERRYAIIGTPRHWVDDGTRDEAWKQHKIGYFKRIHAAIKAPDILAAWMHYLCHWKRTDGLDLPTAVRIPPRNAALAEQKESGFSGVDGFWFDVLTKGSFAEDLAWNDKNPLSITMNEIIENLKGWHRGRKGERNLPSAKSIGKTLAKIAPSVSKDRATSGARDYYYALPPITVAREEFAQAQGIAFDHLFDEDAQTERDVFKLV